MKKLVLAGLVFGSLAMAQTYYDVLPYGGYISYGGSTTKDSGYTGGVYLSATKSPWKTEINTGYTQIKYKDSTPKLKQLDLTLKINYYQGYNLKYNIGMHYIDSTDSLTDSGKIYMAGISYYETLMYNLGADIYYSDYSNLSTSPRIYQISPKAGINFGDYNSDIGSFYAEAKLDYIKVGHNRADNDLKNSYTSLEATLNNYNGAFTTSIGAWVGKRSYAVENSGFVVNNIGNEQTGGIKASESYKIDNTQSVKGEYSYTKFTDDGDAHSQTIVASYNYNF